MKVIFEFDTESENFNPIELERYKQVDNMTKALSLYFANRFSSFYKFNFIRILTPHRA